MVSVDSSSPSPSVSCVCGAQPHAGSCQSAWSPVSVVIWSTVWSAVWVTVWSVALVLAESAVLVAVLVWSTSPLLLSTARIAIGAFTLTCLLDASAVLCWSVVLLGFAC